MDIDNVMIGSYDSKLNFDFSKYNLGVFLIKFILFQIQNKLPKHRVFQQEQLIIQTVVLIILLNFSQENLSLYYINLNSFI